MIPHPGNDKRQRRRFTGEHKLRILAQVDASKGGGEVAALLQEGLYSSQLTDWRKQQHAHGDAGLEAKRPGRKPASDERDRVIEKLEREKAKQPSSTASCSFP